MEPKTITIQPPITEHCADCDYEKVWSFYSHHAECPECGGSHIRPGARPPKKQPIRVSKTRGSYNITDPSEKQYNYRFRNVPGCGVVSFVVDEDLDTSDPLDLARELKDIIDRYFYSSSKKKINELVEVICTEEMDEEQDKLRDAERRQQLERELYRLID